MTNVTRPALETLGTLRNGKVMDDIALALKEAASATKLLGKPSEVILKIKIKPYASKGTVLHDQPIMLEAEVTTKVPKPEKEATLYFVDDSGNPTQQQPAREDRQGGLSLRVGSAA